MQIKRIKESREKRGIVLLMTLIIVVILMVVAGSILFSSLNQNTSTQESVDDIKAEELAKGLMWKKSYTGDFTLSPTDAEVIGGKVCEPVVDTVAGDKKKVSVKCK